MIKVKSTVHKNNLVHSISTSALKHPTITTKHLMWYLPFTLYSITTRSLKPNGFPSLLLRVSPLWTPKPCLGIVTILAFTNSSSMTCIIKCKCSMCFSSNNSCKCSRKSGEEEGLQCHLLGLSTSPMIIWVGSSMKGICTSIRKVSINLQNNNR